MDVVYVCAQFYSLCRSAAEIWGVGAESTLPPPPSCETGSKDQTILGLNIKRSVSNQCSLATDHSHYC